MRILLISIALVAVAGTIVVAYCAFWLSPNDAVAFYNRGVAYAAQAQYDRAIADYDQAIRLNPKDPATLVNRGYAYHAKAQ